MHSSDSIVSYASFLTKFVSVFQSLSYTANLKGALSLNRAVSNIPPKMKNDGSCIRSSGTCFVRHSLTSMHDSEKKPKHMKDANSKNVSAEDPTHCFPRKQFQRFWHRLQYRATENQNQYLSRTHEVGHLSCLKG